MSELILGLVYYFWDGLKWCDFYYWIVDEVLVDCVVFGEIVCFKW